MGLFAANTAIKNVYAGSVLAKGVYVGATKVWPVATASASFEDFEAGSRFTSGDVTILTRSAASARLGAFGARLSGGNAYRTLFDPNTTASAGASFRMAAYVRIPTSNTHPFGAPALIFAIQADGKGYQVALDGERHEVIHTSRLGVFGQERVIE